MEYISLGTAKLLEEYFYPVVNSDRNIKPAGGFWCSGYYAPTFIEWLDYIASKPTYYRRYAKPMDPFAMSGVIVNIKSNTNIFELDSKEACLELEQKYHYDYEALEQDYEGIYIDPFRIIDYDADAYEQYHRFIGVRTLNLFDINLVTGYRQADITIDPFDYTYEYDHYIDYDTIVHDEIESVIPASETYKALAAFVEYQLKDFIYHLQLEHPDYPRNKMAFLVKEELLRTLKQEISDYVIPRDLDEERIAYSMAIRALKKTK